MALELTYASDTALLLDDLVDSLGRPGSAAGVVVPVLMPSLPLVDRTKVALAQRHGVAMGVVFFLPSAFIDHIAQLVGLDPVSLLAPAGLGVATGTVAGGHGRGRRYSPPGGGVRGHPSAACASPRRGRLLRPVSVFSTGDDCRLGRSARVGAYSGEVER